MAQQTINIGAAVNDGTGDPVRSAFNKTNLNFTEVYADLAGKAPVSHTHLATSISDSSAVGRAVLTAVDEAAQRTALGLGAMATKASVGVADLPQTGTPDSTKAFYGDGTWKVPAGGGGGITWSTAVNANVLPDATGTRDLGSPAFRFDEIHANSLILGGTTFSGGTLSDPNADGLIGWDDSASATIYFTLGNGLSFSGATIAAEVSLAGAETLTNKTLTAPVITLGLNAQTGTSYTLVAGDAHKKITMDNAAANVLNIPANASVAFPVGTIIGVTQIGAGVTTVDGATGVTVNGVSGGAGAISARWTGVTLIKIGTDSWLMEGNHGAVA